MNANRCSGCGLVIEGGREGCQAIFEEVRACGAKRDDPPVGGAADK